MVSPVRMAFGISGGFDDSHGQSEARCC